jgi:hypothetical protein
MNEAKKIPAWAVGMILTTVGVLFTIAGGLATFIFTGQIAKIDRIEEVVTRQSQQLAVMQIQIDTQVKACRLPNK